MFNFMLFVHTHLAKEEGESKIFHKNSIYIYIYIWKEENLAVSDDLSELNTCSYRKEY